MARVAYFVHGRGKGHAVRARSVLSRLSADGHELFVFGGGEAARLLADRRDFAGVRPCVPGPGLVRTLAARIVEDIRRLQKLEPDAVVSDADSPSVHAAAVLKLPTLSMGHGLVFGHCRVPPELPWRGRLRERINAASSSWPCRHRVAVHFSPVAPRTRGTRVARPDLPAGLSLRQKTEDFILAYFRDDNGQDVMRQLVARGYRVVCFGTAQSVPPGVEQRSPSADEFAEHLSRCLGVVASAGNHLPAECAMVGKPLLAVYRPGDVEQQMNAQLIEAAQIGVVARIDCVDHNTVSRFVELTVSPPRGAQGRVQAMPPASEVVSVAVAELVA